MVQKLMNLSKWSEVKPGTAVEFLNEKPRMVRVDVNAPGDTRLHVVDESGEVSFLALVTGRDTIEFGVDGPFLLTTDGPVQVYSPDGEDIHFTILDAVSFTEIAERQVRNPEMEEMLYRMNLNIEARLAQQAEALERAFNARAATETVVVPPPVAAPSDDKLSGEEPSGDPSGDPAGAADDAGADK